MGKPLLDVLSGQKPERRPVWLMRQAGRYLPEYREVRAKAGSFLKLCYAPDDAAEVTLQPLRRFDLDAAIIFSDILVVPHAMGLELDFLEGEGPRLQTVSDSASVNALRSDAQAWQFGRVCETLRQVSADLPPGKTLIGFCGAPWTVASYMIEGGSSGRAKAVAVAASNAVWFAELIDRLIGLSVEYLAAQVRAGAEVVQIFDSWAGDLVGEAREKWVVDPLCKMVADFRRVCPGVPVIVFARGVGRDQARIGRLTGANAVSVEQDTILSDVIADLPLGCAVQGNLAPEILVQGGGVLEDAAVSLVRQIPMGRHVFNLGHGIVPHTPPQHVADLIEVIRRADGVGV